MDIFTYNGMLFFAPYLHRKYEALLFKITLYRSRSLSIEGLTSAPFLLLFLLNDVLFFFLLDFIEDCGIQTDVGWFH